MHGKYRVEALIGEGGMGAVVKAHHIGLDEPVAIKCLLPEMMDNKDIVTRFTREAKAAVKLKGEHVARVLDVGQLDNKVPYIVMEYLDGSDLGEIIKHYGKQDPAVSVDLIMQACEALAEAHSLGIIHRDVKASNFFVVQPPGQAPCLKVLDFGIATAPEGTSDLTGTQAVIGTPAYMAPEQMRAASKADQRSDIWSIGVVLYDLLEAARPFRSDVYSELVLKVGMDPPHPMSNRDVSPELEDIVMRCLEKDMEARFQNVADLALALMPFASDQTQARAIAEQCTRLLRRSTKTFEIPDSGPIKRLTPRSMTAVGERTPISQSRPQLPMPPTTLGRPTPTSAQRQPTSVQGSSGQVAKIPSIAPRGRGVWIGFFVICVLGLAGGAFYYTQYYDTGKAAASQPLPPPPPPPERVLDYNPRPEEPPPPPQVGSGSGSGSAVEPAKPKPKKSRR